jgi:putative spermidine/putrescine transport system ATP-binding protein
MADRVAVFNQGRIEQSDTPRALYTRPQTAFVAGFVGSANVLPGQLAERLTGRDQPFAIRPELITLLAADGQAPAGHVVCDGTLEDVLYHGASSRLHVRIDGVARLAVARAETTSGPPLPAPGTRVRLAWPRDAAVPLAG